MKINKALADPKSLYTAGTSDLRKPRLGKLLLPKVAKMKTVPQGIKLIALMRPKGK